MSGVRARCNNIMHYYTEDVGNPPFDLWFLDGKLGQRLVTDRTKYVSQLIENTFTTVNYTTNDEGQY